MSSATNHRKRSHRSYRNSVSTLESFQRKQMIKSQNKEAMKTQKSLFSNFKNLLNRRKTPENKKMVKIGGTEK